MKRSVTIPRFRLYAPVDYTQVLKSGSFAGVDLSYRALDAISVSSGAVCFFDAYTQTGTARPFMQHFKPGKAVPFYAAVATNAGERIAYAGLRFSEAAPVEWKLALYEERDVIKLTADPGSYPVSVMIHSGFIGFSDYIVQREYFSFVRAGNADEHPLDGALRFEGNTAVLFPVGKDGAKTELPSVAVFSSGWGDGEYPAYIGFDADGNAAAVLCDFLMIDAPKAEQAPGAEVYEFDIEIEQLYQNDPSLDVEENNVAKWTFVIDHKDEVDDIALCRAYARRGYAYHSLRSLEPALADYYTAMELAERLESGGMHKMREWTLYDNAGTINKELGNLAEAKRLFEKGKAVGDNFYSGAYISLIDIYSSEKDYEKAAETAAEMVRVRPADPLSYAKSAEVCVAAGKYEKAIEYYDILIERFRWDEAIMEKTACLGLLGCYEDALATLETYLTENQPTEVYYHNKGFLQYKQHRFFESYQNLLQAYECNPEFAPTLNLLIDIDDTAFRFERVLKWSSQYIAIRPESEYGYSVRAAAYARLSDFAAAADDYERILDGISDDPAYLHRFVRASLLAGDFKKAQKRLKKYRGENPYLYAHCRGLFARLKGKTAKAESLFIYANVQTEDALCDLADFYTQNKIKARAIGAVAALTELTGITENSAIRKYNFLRVFGSPDQADAFLDEYLNNRLPGFLQKDPTEAAHIKERIQETAGRFVAVIEN